jgi:hypothetical protein
MADKKPPISFDRFCRTALGAWSDDATAPAGESFTNPRDAARRAAYLASIEHDGKAGIILVVSPDTANAKSCREYLHAFYEQQALANLLVKMTPDGVELRGGTIITVDTNDKRRLRDVLATIRLDTATHAPVEEFSGNYEIRHAQAVNQIIYEGGPVAEELIEWFGREWVTEQQALFEAKQRAASEAGMKAAVRSSGNAPGLPSAFQAKPELKPDIDHKTGRYSDEANARIDAGKHARDGRDQNPTVISSSRSARFRRR